jgi:hypothetical protein
MSSSTDETAQKRAQWEQFDFDVEAPGMVEVANESHDNPAEHHYIVTVDDVTGRCNGLHLPASRPPQRRLQAHGCRRERNRRWDA